MRNVNILFGLLALVLTVNGQCFKPETKNPFDVNSYFGRWYEVEGLPSSFSPLGSRCEAANYDTTANGTFRIRNSQVNADFSYSDICGYAYVPDPTYPGELIVQFDGRKFLILMTRSGID